MHKEVDTKLSWDASGLDDEGCLLLTALSLVSDTDSVVREAGVLPNGKSFLCRMKAGLWFTLSGF